ncbi:hypothetical protein CC78DRAFT_251544 [Lojkania enalia]|uniref:Acyltransferase 3 domain-containing protein n=1 Tax=Lojkania enalia TaxID=147567 RepID=A0A9P4KD08_9PLEO|nr:hypothetical protein CC78DRAFT_251544 [Didymosphaeria enalia]
MVFSTQGGLDAAPLLRAEFDEKLEGFRQSSVAWLDGLRGIAAFFVFIYHFQHEYHKAYNFGYGGAGPDKHGLEDHWLIQLPIIRLIFTGGPMVSVFWVLSGISLSLKPIKLARSQSWDKFFDTMFSSVFRRMLRLYIPVFFVQVCVLLATLFGLYNNAHRLSKDWPFYGTNEVQHEVKDSAVAQIADWSLTMWKFLNPFVPIRPKYDVHLWTIQLEYRNSIVLFATLIGYAKLKAHIRVYLTIALYAFLVLIEQGDVGLFIAGMGCAEFLLILDERSKKPLPSPTTDSFPDTQSRRSRFSWAIVYVLGLWLLSWPAWGGERTPGYGTIQALTPSFIKSAELTYQRLGAAVTLLGLCGAPFLRVPFEHPLSVYLGKISFPLYIVHGPINHIVGEALVPFFWDLVGDESLVRYEFGVFLAWIVCAVLVVWSADVVMRVVDGPSVRFGRWLQNRWAV